jgi:autotransporter-associated beta strand protein
MNTEVNKILAVLAFVASTQALHAGSATWNLNPTSNDWNTAENWTPPTIPSSETDVATFAVSNTTSVVCGDAPGGGGTTTIVGDIVFNEGASAYTITVTPVFDNIFPSILAIYGGGITNNSGLVQNLVTANSGTTKASGRIYFNGSSSAGDNVVITNEGGASATGDGVGGGFTEFGYDFTDTASAGNATVINNGGEVSGAVGGGALLLSISSSNSATFINNPGEVSGAGSGSTLIQTLGNIGNSTFIGNAATVTGAEGAWVEIDYGTAAGASFIGNGATTAGPQAGQIYVYGGDGYATFTGEGGNGSGAEGGLIDLFALLNSDQTVVIAEDGINGGLGGTILIEGHPVLDLGQFQVFGNGLLDLTPLTAAGVTIGSLAGDGMVLLAGHALSIGNNNLSTTFSGVIQDTGSVIKLGTGTLTLGGASTYAGVTTVTAGTLLVANQSGSATGNGTVKVNSGTLGGTGIISGKTNIGTGSGTGAFLAPAAGTNVQATLTIQSALTFNADATYVYTFRAKRNRATTDKVLANGVTINSGAMIALSGQTRGRLTAGLTLTLISNTSANPISGTFANLPNGGIVTINGNNFQAGYSGGDGNDLILTVVP